MSTRTRSLAVLGLLLALALPAQAQRFTATVRGTVVDAAGSAIPGAEVSLRNSETGLARSAATNQAGIYSFGDLPPGVYTIRVEHPGHKQATVTQLDLNVADIRQVDVTLEVGEIEDEITVEASAVSVETIGGEVAGLISGEQVRELPLNGRNFTQLTLLMPGVSAPDSFDTSNKGLLTGSDLSVSGGGVTGNLWTVDGANNNDVGSNRTILVYPSVDAIEEIKIHRNSYGAEFGGASGAQVNLITRGGTNAYHGGVFYFTRDDAWNETNYFLEQAGQDKERLSRDDFGYTFGGPIVQDKLHFFVSQEWNDETRGTVRTGFVPTEAERRGDFSGPRIPGCSPPVPVDPLTGQPFPGNVIPADRLSPGGLAFLGLYPLPNVTPTGGSCNNWVASVDTGIEWSQLNGRLDWNLSDRTRLMVRGTFDTWENTAPNAGTSNGLWGDDAFPAVDSGWDQPGYSVVAQLNQTLGDSAVNTLQLSYSGNEIDIARGGQNPGLNSQITAAIPTIFGDKLAGDQISHPTFWGGQGYAPLWNIPPWENQQDLVTLKDDYQQVFGEHWVKVGASYSDNKKDEFIGAGSFETPQFWGSAGLGGWGANTGNILSDFLLEGMTFGFSENSANRNVQQRWEDFEVYIADSWQISPRVTLDVGVRYSLFGNPTEANDIFANFDPDLYDPALGADPCNGLLLPPGSNACAEAGFQGGTQSSEASLVRENTDNVAPRLGIAWDVFGDGRAALRAGFGQFYQRDRLSPWLVFAANPPFGASQSGIRTLDSAEEPCAGCFALGSGIPANGYDPDRENPYNWQWNISWEQRVGRETTVEVSYVGSRGLHLLRRADINQVAPGDKNGNGVSDRLEFTQNPGNNGLLGSLRPFDAFGNSSILYWLNDGESEYHSLQTQVISRFGRGSHFQASYTWSELKSNDPLDDSGAGLFPGAITDFSDLDLDWGYAETHREHVFNSSLILNLPELSSQSDLVQALFGDWTVGTIVSYASGAALSVNVGSVPGLNGVSGTGYSGNERPLRVPGVSCRASGGDSEQWLNPEAWTLEGFELGTIGNARRGECEGPDFFQVDLSLFKNIQLSDSVRAQLRIEIFNLFDRANFLDVNTLLNPTNVEVDDPTNPTRITAFTPSGTFGRATGARAPRQIQLGLKINF